MNTPDTNTVKGKIAVMTAAAAGKKIERRLRDAALNSGLQTLWQPTSSLSWNWHNYDYRVAPSPIAPGHNPDQLTEEQVEVKFGWRLLTEEEIGERPPTFDIQLYTARGWATDKVSGDVRDYTYRTRRPPGFFLPKPAPKLRPISAKDWEKYPIIWVRDRMNTDRHELVHIIRPEDFGYGFNVGIFEAFKAADYLEWSPDRINWHSFTVNE